jgi:hypothetical protein
MIPSARELFLVKKVFFSYCYLPKHIWNAWLPFLHFDNYRPLSPGQHSLTVTLIHSWNVKHWLVTAWYKTHMTALAQYETVHKICWLSSNIWNSEDPECWNMTILDTFFYCLKLYPKVWWNVFSFTLSATLYVCYCHDYSYFSLIIVGWKEDSWPS